MGHVDDSWSEPGLRRWVVALMLTGLPGLRAVPCAHRSAGARPPAMVQAIAKAAFEASMDRQRSTPYSKAATEAFDMCFSGGKPDDISIVVAVCS